MPASLRALRVAIAAALLISASCFVLWSWRWPLVGDASLIHYIAFLIGKGMAPYRDLGDMNMPISFLIEMGAMKIFGGGAFGLRLFDFSLLAAAAVAFRIVTRRAGWLPTIFAAALFALAHGRDGLEQGGQRDLTMAVLLIGATAALFVAIRRRSSVAMLVFGLLADVAFNIKPTVLPLSLTQLLIAILVLRKTPGGPVTRRALSAAFGGLLIGPLLALGFLLQQHAVVSFWANLHGIVPYYTSLGHRPLSFLLTHSISPLMPLVFLWFAVLLLARPRLIRPGLDWERALLLIGVVFALISYIIQARGFPYHRYPLLAFLLALMALDFTESLLLLPPSSSKPQQAGAVLALLALAFGGLFLAPQSALQIRSFRPHDTFFSSSLEANLNRLGGPALSGHIQCIDWVDGCLTTLYWMKLVPATGMLEDYLLFGPSTVPIVAETRKTFGNAILEHPPKVIVVSSRLYIDGPHDFKKLDRWPDFKDFLTRNYTLDTAWAPTTPRRWWSRTELGPSYRIYVLKATPQ